MQNVIRFSVIPRLPERLEPLRKLAFNLWYSWEPDAVALFRTLDPELWEVCYHNPVKLLQRVRQSRLHEVIKDDGFMRKLDTVYKRFQDYISLKETWFAKNQPPGITQPIA